MVHYVKKENGWKTKWNLQFNIPIHSIGMWIVGRKSSQIYYQYPLVRINLDFWIKRDFWKYISKHPVSLRTSGAFYLRPITNLYHKLDLRENLL